MTATELDPAAAEPETPLLQQKLIATATHVGLSMLAIGALLLITTRIWYPDFLFATDGGWEGLQIVILVDLVLGPALTFVVFRRGKPGLLMDLVLIGALQIAALGVGGWIIHAERPLALVFWGDRFYTITPDDYLDSDRPLPDLTWVEGDPPRMLGIEFPNDPDLENEILGALRGADAPPYSHAPWFVPMVDVLDEVLASGVRRAYFEDRDPTALARFFAEHGGDWDQWVFVPYSSRFNVEFLAIHRESGRVQGLLDLDD